ncbi:MAG: DUF1573 domain-containing protein [Candidatus Komeilibacteria bacterium]|nr:DUF1573 domain-containing protein [Candidatus Komeilibacteria bacterium]
MRLVISPMVELVVMASMDFKSNNMPWKKTIIIIGIGLALALAMFYLLKPPVKIAGQITVDPRLVEWGEIRRSDGLQTAAITVTNIGNDDLIINRLSTSCGCTSAVMDESPLSPGEKRIMEITFDPTVHPDEVGPVARVVYLQTNDPDDPEIEIDLSGVIVPQ